MRLIYRTCLKWQIYLFDSRKGRTWLAHQLQVKHFHLSDSWILCKSLPPCWPWEWFYKTDQTLKEKKKRKREEGGDRGERRKGRGVQIKTRDEICKKLGYNTIKDCEAGGNNSDGENIICNMTSNLRLTSSSVKVKYSKKLMLFAWPFHY